MNEFDLITRLTALLPPGDDTVKTGPGDDCAVLDLGVPGKDLLFKTDAVVEGVHFTKKTPPDKVGHKAIARCLSDIAAMGGTPHSALITIALPKNYDPEVAKAVYRGLGKTAQKYGVRVVGGETTTNPDCLLISIAMLGTVPAGKAILRSGAKSGDAIFVTGNLGGSLSGRHLEFEPRLTEANWLREKFDVHAMIDLSDGLAGDLRHILKASHVGAELLGTAVPISQAAKELSRAESSAKPPLLAALTDGEDFELLFTVASKDAVAVLDKWKQRFPELEISCVGRITAVPGLKLRDKTGSLKDLSAHGYVHFT